MQVFKTYYKSTCEAAILAAFRVFFGVLMLISLLRFLSKGWVDTLYIKPLFHFKYYGFEWVTDLGKGTYFLFVIAIISAFFVLIGWFYRTAITLFFLVFTYIELIDKTTYLNHYYFISVLSFLLIFLPLNASFSIDSFRRKKEYQKVQRYTVDCIKLLVSIVYFYAGLAKLNSDWLLRAKPLSIWLTKRNHYPIIGDLMDESWFHYAMSWSGALYDLSIPFLLYFSRTRKFAFVTVVLFHLATSILFPIGMFPYIMIFSCIIFFNGSFHVGFIDFLKRVFTIKRDNVTLQSAIYKSSSINIFVILIFFTIQLFLPFRYFCYPGELFWTEEGYRFSWRVMLIEKAGDIEFRIRDNDTGDYELISNDDFLTPFQIRQMKTQPDFILEFAHILGDYYSVDKEKRVSVFAESYVSLNGRIAKQYINPKVDLYNEKESLRHKYWIFPCTNDIKGF